MYSRLKVMHTKKKILLLLMDQACKFANQNLAFLVRGKTYLNAIFVVFLFTKLYKHQKVLCKP